MACGRFCNLVSDVTRCEMVMFCSFSFMQAMEKLVDMGLCKAIGISNFTVKKTRALLETAEIPPACNQGMYAIGFLWFKITYQLC